MQPYSGLTKAEFNERWAAYRKKHLTPNGWRHSGPGCYWHERWRQVWYPFDIDGNTGRENWLVLEEQDRPPVINDAT